MTYFFYVNRMLNRRGRRHLRIGAKSQVVPGWVGDPDPRKKFKHKFNKWRTMSYAAQRLYWLTHPQFVTFKRTK